MAKIPASQMNTEQAMTRSAATAIVALGSSPVTIRSVAAAKSKKDEGRSKETIRSLPMPISALINRYWHQQSVEKKWLPDVEKLDQTKVPALHPELAPYWGNVDDVSSIYLFDRPTPNYVPIKFPGSVQFTDVLMVSSYLINCMLYLIK